MSFDNPWRRLGSSVVHRNPWFQVREDSVLRPDGSPGTYTFVETRIATGVVALTDELEIVLVGQYRYPTEEYSWELPEGGTEGDEQPIEAARRELLEEAGVIASLWEQLGGEIHLSNCISSERGFLYLARELTWVASSPDPTEILIVRTVPFAECLEMVDRGEIRDSITVVGVLRAARRLGLG